MDNVLLYSILSGVSCLALGIAIMLILSRIGLNKNLQKSSLIIKEANIESENLLRQAILDGKTQVHEMKLVAEKEIKEKKNELSEAEHKLNRREDNLTHRDENLTNKEKQIDEKMHQVTNKLSDLNKIEEQLKEKLAVQINELERVASLSEDEAKKELFEVVERKMQNEVTAFIKDKEDEAKSRATEKSREILALAIQRYSQEEASERTVSVVGLPNDEMKGRIIGREGRNIRAIEQATGVDLIIDDTPEAITVSCFDPIRREIARLSLEALIRDGRIQPGRIEEVVQRVTKELNETIFKAGENAIFKLGIGKMSRELIQLLGRLQYRYSYGQNALQHSVEVATFAGIMAAELGLNQNMAKRAGLLHDIGKALDFEVEGSHVELGIKACKKYGEDPIVINAIASHHGDEEPTGLISNLVIAADTLSAARPGARYEAMENYINRLEQLEKIATGFDGVDKCYAISSGREIRVMVMPDKMDDLKMAKVARDIREKIENELTYPGQIKVTLIREVRVNELAK
ncbi:MAG: ribonuclease Y [Erysipelotrichaceae bacterium]